MGDLSVGAGERGAVRVFAIAASGPDWTDTTRPDWKLPGALGVGALGEKDVQVFAKSDLAGMSLAEFLSDGYDIPQRDLAAQARALEDATGVIAIVRSAAFTVTPVELALSPLVALVGRFDEPDARPGAGGLEPYESAKPRSAPAASPPPDTPAPEDDGARVLETFRPSREAYIRSHLWLGAAAMGGATAILYLVGNPSYWVGIIAGFGAIAVRGVYLASEELGLRWELTETSLRGRGESGAITRVVALGDVDKVRRLGSAVQVVTKRGDKLLMKYIADPAGVQARIARAAGVSLA